MVDVVSPEVRSKMMSGIRGKNTKPEFVVRRVLFAEGFRFRLHRRDLPGAPDVILPGRKVAIFVHGCFWHQHQSCRFAKLPATRPDFWKNKLDGNVRRDEQAIDQLGAAGWRVLTVWECATRDKASLAALPRTLSEWINGASLLGEVRGF
jgi:DNA mismatch endonuclease, patch repair protein